MLTAAPYQVRPARPRSYLDFPEKSINWYFLLTYLLNRYMFVVWKGEIMSEKVSKVFLKLIVSHFNRIIKKSKA